jgi:glutaminyl-peptide cyclotransferase
MPIRIPAGAAWLLIAASLPAAQPSAPSFTGSRALEDVRRLVAIGPRVAGSPGAERAREYIKTQLTSIGLNAEEQAFESRTPLGPVKMINLRVQLPRPAADTAGRLVIAGHYDTKLFKEFAFVGANDGGSSAAFLIELARVLKGRRNALPIELLFLDGEEAVIHWQEDDHTYGSRHYVNAARMDGTLKDIRALILVDMIGDRDLRIKREANSTRWLTDAIWAAAKQLKKPQFVEEETPIEDDHIEFLEAGVQAVDIIDLEYPAWHTKDDTLDKVSADSLQVVGDVLLAALPAIESRLVK